MSRQTPPFLTYLRGFNMRRIFKLLIVAAGTALTALPAVAAAPAPAAPAVACVAPDYTGPQMSWFLGINPRDNLVAVWCRLQALPGAVRFNVLFPLTQAHRSWDTAFAGRNYPPARIVEIVQSLIPVGEGPVNDDKGMPFGRVLQNVVQLAALEAPDGQPLGFAADHPAAKELVLWEPLVLRVRPVALAGQEFVLKIVMRPNLGLLAMGLQNPAYDLRVQGWTGRMKMGTGAMFGSGCSSEIPQCKDLGQAPIIHTPWIVDEVILEAVGESMTATAAAVMNQLMASYRPYLNKGSPTDFDMKFGRGNLLVTDGVTEVKFLAEGGNSGTNRIAISYKEVSNEFSVRTVLQKAGEDFRAGQAKAKKAAPVPDSLGRL